MPYEAPRHDLETSRDFLTGLLPDSRGALREALAPEGWDASPLGQYAFASPDEQETRAQDVMDEMNDMLRDAGNEPVEDGAREMMFEHMHRRDPAPDVGDTGACDVMGMCLWDVFSDNHRVVDSDGVIYDLGTFRASAGAIAEVLNETYDLGQRYTYLDFYMGASFVEEADDLRPVYEWIFRRLYERDCNWHYTFPRLYLISFDREEAPDDPAAYDPSASVERDLEREEKEEEIDELREELDRMHREAVEEAKEKPPPLVVQAYRSVFGEWPSGWPPTA